MSGNTKLGKGGRVNGVINEGTSKRGKKQEKGVLFCFPFFNFSPQIDGRTKQKNINEIATQKDIKCNPCSNATRASIKNNF